MLMLHSRRHGVEMPQMGPNPIRIPGADRTKGQSMWDYLKLAGLGLVAVCAAIAANHAHDLAYQVNAITVMLAAGIAFLWVLRTAGDANAASRDEKAERERRVLYVGMTRARDGLWVGSVAREGTSKGEVRH